ncbi:MAG: aminotransferase class IV [Sulfurospirillaceae bacterium]|nr:aminotransferase class IV [Sulfurospirillaceae bacterium]
MSCVTKSTSLAFETIKAIDGRVQHIRFHQERFDKTRKDLFNASHPLLLASLLSPPKGVICRVRVCYGKDIEKIEYIPYVSRKIQTFRLVEASLQYDYKLCDREAINQLMNKESDDVIMVKEGVLKDASIANIALQLDGTWYTPENPLLKGTVRQRLLESQALYAKHLTIEDIEKSEKFAIMNALIGFEIIKNFQIIKGKH